MPRATRAAATFNSSRHLLSDGSTVFNLRLWTHEGIWIDITEMASEATAEQCGDILTRVLNRFAACGSHQEVLRLAVAIEDTLKSVAKS